MSARLSMKASDAAGAHFASRKLQHFQAEGHRWPRRRLPLPYQRACTTFRWASRRDQGRRGRCFRCDAGDLNEDKRRRICGDGVASSPIAPNLTYLRDGPDCHQYSCSTLDFHSATDSAGNPGFTSTEPSLVLDSPSSHIDSTELLLSRVFVSLLRFLLFRMPRANISTRLQGPPLLRGIHLLRKFKPEKIEVVHRKALFTCRSVTTEMSCLVYAFLTELGSIRLHLAYIKRKRMAKNIARSILA